MAIRIEYASPGLAGLAGLLQGTGQAAVTAKAEAERTKRIAMQISGQRKAAAMRTQAQKQIASANRNAANKRQAASLNAQRAGQHKQIQARAQREAQASDQAYKRMAVQFGLQGELKEQAFDLQVKMLEEQAKQRASQRKLILTEDDKRNSTAAARLQKFAKDPDSPYSEGERKQMLQKASALEAGVGTYVPDFKEKLPPGIEPGTFGPIEIESEDGTKLTFPFISGRSVKPEDSIQGARAKQQQVQQEKQLKEERDLQNKKNAAILGLIGKDYSQQVPERMVPGILWGENLEEATTKPAVHTVESATKVVERIFGQTQQATPQATPRVAPPQQVAPPQSGQPGWQNLPEARNLIIYQDDLRFPPKVGFAMSYMRTALRKFGPKRNSWPKETKESYEKAQEIVADFQRPGLGLEK